MKKLILFVVAITSLSLSASAQFAFYVQGDAQQTNYAGSTYQIQALDATDQYTKIDVYNMTGSDDSFVIGRRRVAPEAGSWTDYMCWGGPGGGGLCIDAPIMDQEYFQMTNSAVPILDTENGLLESHIEPDFTDAGTQVYRYYVGTIQNPLMDSMDVEVSLSPLSVETPTLVLGVQPNPANDFISINTNGVEGADLKIVDVLGNVVKESKISGKTTINVAEYRNGVYFVTVSANGIRQSRRVVVRH